MYTVYHGSWRDFTTAVGVFSRTLVRKSVSWKVLGSLRSHGTRDKAGSIIDKGYRERLAWKRSVRCAHTAHASLMGAYAPKRSANRAWSCEGQRSSVLRLQRMAQLSDLVIWFARNWWMFGATVFCSLRSHGTRLLLTQQSKPCLVMGKAGVCACVVIS